MRAVNDVSFAIDAGETLGIVGESGSGKSQIFMSIMGLLAKNGRADGSVQFKGKEILGLPVEQLNQIRGVKMSMIFQDPMTSLNPYLTVKRQMTEVLELHQGMSAGRGAAKAAVEMLDVVQIPEAKRRLDMYPARILRRHAPARDDRHGAAVRAGAADRRRADHRARRHGAGADPRPARRAEARDRHGDRR